MLEDPFANLMLVILIFFVGLLIFFVLIMRSLDSSRRNNDEASRQIALSLSDLEHKITSLDHSVQKLLALSGVERAAPAAPAGGTSAEAAINRVAEGAGTSTASLADGSLTDLLRQMNKTPAEGDGTQPDAVKS